jgi:hypothetical protein
MDEAPLLLVSNWHTTFLFSRRLDDVRNKTLQVSQWAWDSTDVPPLGAFLYVLHRAHQLWHNDAKQQLPRAGVPVTPRSGYEVQLGSRQVQLGTHFGGWRPAPSRSQPPRTSVAWQPFQAGGEGDAAEELHSDTSSLLLPIYSSSSSSHNSSSDDGAGQFDAVAWAEGVASWSSAAVAVEALPVLSSCTDCSSMCLSSSSNRRVFKVNLQAVQG